MYILPTPTHLEVVALGDSSDISPDQHLNYASDGLPFGGAARPLLTSSTPISSPFAPVLAGVLVPELRTAQENARLEIGSQRGRNSYQINFLGIYDL